MMNQALMCEEQSWLYEISLSLSLQAVAGMRAGCTDVWAQKLIIQSKQPVDDSSDGDDGGGDGDDDDYDDNDLYVLEIPSPKLTIQFKADPQM